MSPARPAPSAAVRNCAVDLTKALAIAGVVLIHVSAGGVGAPAPTSAWLSALFWGSISRGAVPLFFMCSGALLLDPCRPLPFTKLYTRTIPRILAALFFWAVCYLIFDLSRTGTLTAPNLVYGLKEVALFRHESHLYYLHILLLVYAFLPLTRRWIGLASGGELGYGLALWFVLGILYPTLRPLWPFTLLSGIPTQWLMNMSYAAIGYGVLGRVICARPPRLGWSAAAFLGGFAWVFGGTALLSLRSGALWQPGWEGMSVGVCLFAAGGFGLCQALAPRLGPGLTRCAQWLSRASFCVYLVHLIPLGLLADRGITIGLGHPALTIPLLSGGVLLASCGAYAVLRRLPFVGRWLV